MALAEVLMLNSFFLFLLILFLILFAISNGRSKKTESAIESDIDKIKAQINEAKIKE